MLKKTLILSLSLLVLISMAFTSGPVLAKKIEIRVITAWSQKAVEHYGFFLLLDELKKKLGDRIDFKYLGGPEVIPYFDQYEMLGKGMYDMGHLPGNMAKNFLPIAESLHLHHLTPWELRERGVYDIMRKAFEESMNIVFLGTTAGKNYDYVFYTNFKVDSLANFKGKTFRVAPAYVPLLTALGAGSVSMPAGEVYTAMERGVVDGFGWPTIGPLDFGWPEVTKYRVDPPFYPVDVNVYFNKDAFYKLPKDIQETIEQTMLEVEKRVYEEYGKLVAKEEKGIQDKGMTILKLSPEDAKIFLQMGLDEGWKEVLKADPERGQKLRDLMSK